MILKVFQLNRKAFLFPSNKFFTFRRTNYPVLNSVSQPFIDYLKFERRYSAHTVRAYGDDLGQFFDYLDSSFGETPLSSISTAFIRSWLASLKEQKISSKSINRKISSLKSFFKYQL